MEGDSKGDFRGDFKQDMEGQVRSRSGLVQVWFSLQPKFNSFELDSKVGRLVLFVSEVLDVRYNLFEQNQIFHCLFSSNFLIGSHLKPALNF